jgi:DNA-binding NarL/FixJ family response regulator
MPEECSSGYRTQIVVAVTQQNNSEGKRRVLLVDDHEFVRRTLRQFIEAHGEMMVCGESDNAAAALERIEDSQPDLLLLDLSLGEDDGLALLEEVHGAHRDLPVLVISMHSESLFGMPAIRSGARGYLMKSDVSEHLYSAIDTIFAGELYVSDDLREKLRADDG